MITKKEYSFIDENLKDLLCCETFNELEYRFADSITSKNKREVWNAVQLAKKILSYKAEKTIKFDCPETVFNFLKVDCLGLDQEILILLTINSKNRLINKYEIAKGDINQSLVPIPAILKKAVVDGACSIIIAHNHPSGDPTPSREDRNITRRLEDAAQIVSVRLLDHIIIGNSYYSFKEKGLI